MLFTSKMEIFMEIMVETLYKSLGVIPYMVSPRDIKHNKIFVFMGVDIWNKRDKLLLTSKRHFYLRHRSISK